jgi:hypothetical protein
MKQDGATVWQDARENGVSRTCEIKEDAVV